MFLPTKTKNKLWKDLPNLQLTHLLPWSFLGDFNVIMGAHEHRGGNIPTKGPMLNFQSWSENNNLFHIPTKGVKFSRSNKRSNPYCIERRLDKCICNQYQLDSCALI